MTSTNTAKEAHTSNKIVSGLSVKFRSFIFNCIKIIRGNNNFEQAKNNLCEDNESEAMRYAAEKTIYNINELVNSNIDYKPDDLFLGIAAFLGLDVLKIILSSKDGVHKMDKDVIQAVYDMLTNALDEAQSSYISPSKDNEAFRHLASTAASLLEKQLNAGVASTKPISWAERTASKPQSSSVVGAEKSTLVLPDPETGTYEKWANRSDRSEKPLGFLSRVWGKYIDAGVMYQTDLRGGRGGIIKKPLDKRLFDLCSQQCKDEDKSLNDYLPNKSRQIDRELEAANLPDNKRLASLAATAYKRIKK